MVAGLADRNAAASAEKIAADSAEKTAAVFAEQIVAVAVAVAGCVSGDSFAAGGHSFGFAAVGCTVDLSYFYHHIELTDQQNFSCFPL